MVLVFLNEDVDVTRAVLIPWKKQVTKPGQPEVGDNGEHTLKLHAVRAVSGESEISTAERTVQGKVAQFKIPNELTWGSFCITSPMNLAHLAKVAGKSVADMERWGDKGVAHAWINRTEISTLFDKLKQQLTDAGNEKAERMQLGEAWANERVAMPGGDHMVVQVSVELDKMIENLKEVQDTSRDVTACYMCNYDLKVSFQVTDSVGIMKCWPDLKVAGIRVLAKSTWFDVGVHTAGSSTSAMSTDCPIDTAALRQYVELKVPDPGHQAYTHADSVMDREQCIDSIVAYLANDGEPADVDKVTYDWATQELWLTMINMSDIDVPAKETKSATAKKSNARVISDMTSIYTRAAQQNSRKRGRP